MPTPVHAWRGFEPGGDSSSPDNARALIRAALTRHEDRSWLLHRTKGATLLVNLADFVSPSTAAQILGLSKRQMLRLLDRDELTAVATPIGRLIDRRSVEALAEERRARQSRA